MAVKKDNIGEIYSVLIIGVVLLAFFAGYIARGKQTENTK
jgi:hypothetical protein